MTRLKPHKLAGAAAVLLLHVLIAVFLVHAIRVARRAPAPRETILLLAPLPVPAAAPDAATPVSHAPLPSVALPRPDAAIAVPQYVDPKALEGFGRSLFDCRPEAIADLPPEKRAQCAARGLQPDGGVDFSDHTDRSRDAALWSRDRARKNAPLLMPCASNAGIGVGLGTLACLADGMINGFDPRKQSSYGDAPAEESHVPNNGDPPPTYTDPDH